MGYRKQYTLHKRVLQKNVCKAWIFSFSFHLILLFEQSRAGVYAAQLEKTLWNSSEPLRLAPCFLKTTQMSFSTCRRLLYLHAGLVDRSIQQRDFHRYRLWSFGGFLRGSGHPAWGFLWGIIRVSVLVRHLWIVILIESHESVYGSFKIQR